MSIALHDNFALNVDRAVPGTAASGPARVYFPGLNALRFFAALCVLLQHASQLQMMFGYPATTFFVRWLPTGADSVTLFFVLSGFLITYLLLEEKRRTGRVAVGRFYARRALRIWPLYYLITLACFFVLPRIFGPRWVGDLGPSFKQEFVLYLVFLPNVAVVTMPLVMGASHLWSVGIEEQFYLAWPIVVRVLSRRWLLAGIVGIIAAKFAVTCAYQLVWLNTPTAGTIQWYWRLRGMRFECMAIGALGAWVLFYQKRLALRVVFHPLTQLGTWAGVAMTAVWLNHADGPMWLARCAPYADVPLSFVYLALILNVAANPRSLVKLEWRPLSYLGRISYGIYMYHLVVMIGGAAVLHRLGWFERHLTVHDVAFHLIAVGGTIALAALSYRFFEAPCLTLKGRFAVVKSGDGAR